MGDFGAITPGTDLSTHARALRRVHDAVLADLADRASGGAGRPPRRTAEVGDALATRVAG